MRKAYLASDDSALLRRALGSYSGRACLEIGAGNGGNLIDLKKRFSRALGTDVVRPGLDDWKGAGVDYVLADGASCLKDECFDLVAFNPPYLPLEVAEDVAVEGGKELEVPMKFLREALRTVKRTGRVILLLNDQAPIGELEAICTQRGFNLRKVLSQRLFFEELAVYEASADRA
ncbi:MAG: methyltransferase domain-containing protein [Thaumarchaeota archaeon]|nr:methyltransferase domain-containing protein [Nitrososphaerota archaeon]